MKAAKKNRRGRPKKARTLGVSIAVRLDDELAADLARLVFTLPTADRSASGVVRSLIRRAAAELGEAST